MVEIAKEGERKRGTEKQWNKEGRRDGKEYKKKTKERITK